MTASAKVRLGGAGVACLLAPAGVGLVAMVVSGVGGPGPVANACGAVIGLPLGGTAGWLAGTRLTAVAPRLVFCVGGMLLGCPAGGLAGGLVAALPAYAILLADRSPPANPAAAPEGMGLSESFVLAALVLAAGVLTGAITGATLGARYGARFGDT